MSTTATPFFSTEENQATIRSFAATLRALAPFEPPYPEIVGPLKAFFAIFASNTESFDQHCTSNIAWLGRRYMGQIESFLEGDKQRELLLDIFTTSYRLVCELELSQPDDLSFELRAIKNFVMEELEKFQGTHRQQLVYANYVMPANIAKRLIHDSSLADFKAFADSATAARSLKSEWDKEIQVKQDELMGLRDAIDQLKTQYNFVGLVKGFETMVNAKRMERKRTFVALLSLGVLMLLPVCAQLGWAMFHRDALDTLRALLLYMLPAMVGLELILLYFFRVILLNYRGLQTQLLQLDVRVSLCQFIQSYSEYSAKIKKADPAALERFEAVVFNNVISDGEKVPATFDGLEQVANLVKSVRSP